MAPNLSKTVAQNNEEPPSSFPGIWKTPSGRETPFRSGYNWMESKKLDDDIGNLWRVHDKLYDLTPFIPKHPGGSDWLELTQGTDITEAFETSHIVNVDLVEKTLAQFYVQDATRPRISPYTFKEDGFFKTLKKRIAPIMTKVGTGPTKQVILMQDAMVGVFLGCMILGTWLDSTILKIISGFFLAIQLIGAHNFFHLKDNWRKYYFDLGLLSSHEWRITHSLSHHLYPNTLMDIELELFPTYQFLPNRPKNWTLRWYVPVVYSHFLYLVGFWLELARRFYKIAMGEQKIRLENGIVFLQLALLAMIAPTAQAGFWSWIFIHTVSSFTFLTQGANAAHHHPDEFHDGDEARPDPDFGLCQLDATRDKAGDHHENNLWVILVTFGAHQLHHLFPTICHSKLIHINSIFEKTVAEFNENYPRRYQWDMYVGTFRQLARTETKQKSYGVEKKRH